MQCPYCGGAMKNGTLRAGEGHAIYWFPGDAEIDFLFLTKKNIESRGGLILDEHTFGFYAKERPSCYCCMACKILLTKL